MREVGVRAFGSMMVLLSGSLALGACQGGDAQRQALIDDGVRQCVQGFEQTGGSAAGVNGERVCRCALEKMTEGKSIDEIRNLSKQDQPSQADLQHMGACLVQEMQKK